jgi:hypothetical protein
MVAEKVDFPDLAPLMIPYLGPCKDIKNLKTHNLRDHMSEAEQCPGYFSRDDESRGDVTTLFVHRERPGSRKNVAFNYIATYVVLNTPAMPLTVLGYAHFGGFFYARRSRDDRFQ